jgi:hypothetical protein
MSDPESMLSKPEVQELLRMKLHVDQDALQIRADLIADADRTWTFKASDGRKIKLRRLSYSEMIRLVWVNMPDIIKQASEIPLELDEESGQVQVREDRALTLEEQAQNFEAGCLALGAANVSGVTADQIAHLENAKQFVDEAFPFLMEKSGWSSRAVEKLTFFRRFTRRVSVWLHAL